MLLLGQREIKQHTLAMKWRNARIIHPFIIVCHLRRFEIWHHFRAKSLYSFLSKYFVRVTSWIGMPKKLFGTVSFQTKFSGWVFNLSFFSLPIYKNIFLGYIRLRQPRPVYWSPSLTSTYRIYKKSMISWSSKSTNLVLIIDVLVSDHQRHQIAFFYNNCWASRIDSFSFYSSGIFDTIWSSILPTKPSGCGMYNRSRFRF